MRSYSLLKFVKNFITNPILVRLQAQWLNKFGQSLRENWQILLAFAILNQWYQVPDLTPLAIPLAAILGKPSYHGKKNYEWLSYIGGFPENPYISFDELLEDFEESTVSIDKTTWEVTFHTFLGDRSDITKLFLERIRNLPIKKDGHVLVIGHGKNFGEITALIDFFKPNKITGTDKHAGSVKYLAQKSVSLNSSVKLNFYQVKYEDLNRVFSENTFDVIYSAGVNLPRSMLPNLSALLKPEGILIVPDLSENSSIPIENYGSKLQENPFTFQKHERPLENLTNKKLVANTLSLEGDEIDKKFSELDTRYFDYFQSLKHLARVKGIGGDAGVRGFIGSISKYKNIFRWMKHHLGSFENKRILEVGSGTGAFGLALRDLGVNIDLLEQNPDLVTAAKEKGLQVTHGNLLTPPKSMLEAPYDVTLSHHVLDVPIIEGGAYLKNLYEPQDKSIDPYSTHNTYTHDLADLVRGMKAEGYEYPKEMLTLADQIHEAGVKMLQQLARLTKPEGLSIHVTQFGLPFTDADIEAAGFEIISSYDTTVILCRKPGSTSWTNDSDRALEQETVSLNEDGQIQQASLYGDRPTSLQPKAPMQIIQDLWSLPFYAFSFLSRLGNIDTPNRKSTIPPIKVNMRIESPKFINDSLIAQPVINSPPILTNAEPMSSLRVSLRSLFKLSSNLKITELIQAVNALNIHTYSLLKSIKNFIANSILVRLQAQLLNKFGQSLRKNFDHTHLNPAEKIIDTLNKVSPNLDIQSIDGLAPSDLEKNNTDLYVVQDSIVENKLQQLAKGIDRNRTTIMVTDSINLKKRIEDILDLKDENNYPKLFVVSSEEKNLSRIIQESKKLVLKNLHTLLTTSEELSSIYFNSTGFNLWMDPSLGRDYDGLPLDSLLLNENTIYLLHIPIHAIDLEILDRMTRMVSTSA